jgi:hypothetical protein
MEPIKNTSISKPSSVKGPNVYNESEGEDKKSSFGKSIFNGIWGLLKDSARKWNDDKINAALEVAFWEGVEKTTSTLYEAHVNDEIIISLMQKHWGITEDDATENLRREGTIHYPIRTLKTFLASQGFNSWEIEDFIIKNRVFSKLRHDRDLWKLTPAKLSDVVKENK